MRMQTGEHSSVSATSGLRSAASVLRSRCPAIDKHGGPRCNAMQSNAMRNARRRCATQNRPGNGYCFSNSSEEAAAALRRPFFALTAWPSTNMAGRDAMRCNSMRNAPSLRYAEPPRQLRQKTTMALTKATTHGANGAASGVSFSAAIAVGSEGGWNSPPLATAG